MRGRAGWVVLGLAALWQQTCLAWRLPVCASSSGAPSQRRPAADSCTRRSLVLEKGPALVLLGGLVMPSLARAADEEKKAEEIQAALDTLRVELESGKNLGKLESALAVKDWDTLKKYSREYDAYLRGELMGKAKKAMADSKAAQGLRESTMYSLIGVSKGARQQDAEAVAASLADLKALLAQFLALERAAPASSPPASS